MKFSELGLQKINIVNEVNINDKIVNVRTYLPVEDKLALIGEVLENVYDGTGIINPLKIDVFFTLAMIKYYTDIEFTEEDLEDTSNLFTTLETSGAIDLIIPVIPKKEYEEVFNAVNDTINSFYNYNSSVSGLMDEAMAKLEEIAKKYADLDIDAAAIQKKIADPENLGLLKSVLKFLG